MDLEQGDIMKQIITVVAPCFVAVLIIVVDDRQET